MPTYTTDASYKITFNPFTHKVIMHMSIPHIDHVVFSESKRTGKITTVMFFTDGTKTMATPMDGDEFSKDEGINQCILKRIFGNRSKLKKFYKQVCEETDNGNV